MIRFERMASRSSPTIRPSRPLTRRLNSGVRTMPKLAATLLVSLTAVLSGFSNPVSACGKFPVMSGTKEDGTRVELILDSDQIKKTPAWSPGQGEPPFSVQRAVEVGITWANDHYKRFDSVEVSQISLRPFGCSTERNHWYYVIDFTPVMDGSRMHSSFYWAAVLFDGTVVGATESKSSSN